MLLERIAVLRLDERVEEQVRLAALQRVVKRVRLFHRNQGLRVPTAAEIEFGNVTHRDRSLFVICCHRVLVLVLWRQLVLFERFEQLSCK